MITGKGFHPGLVVGGALAEDLLADRSDTDHVAEEVHHLLGSRQAAQVTVYDDAIEAVVDEGQQIAEQLGEQFHGSPPKTRQGSANGSGADPASRLSAAGIFVWPMRCAIFSVKRPISTVTYRDRRPADPVLHRNRRCLVARSRRTARGEAGPRRRERTDPHRGNRYHVRHRLEGTLSHRRTGLRLCG